MEISKQQIQETLNFIVEGCRNRSLTEDREEFIRSEFSHASSNIHGLRLLFTGDETIGELIEKADAQLTKYRNEAIQNRSRVTRRKRLDQQTSDLGRSPALSPTVVGQESTTPKKKMTMKSYPKS